MHKQKTEVKPINSSNIISMDLLLANVIKKKKQFILSNKINHMFDET